MQDPKAIRKALLIAKGLPDRRKMHFSEVGKRIPELEAGANKVSAGEMSGAEYQQLINQHKPVYPYESVPNPASYEEIHRALSATDPRKVSKIGKLADYPEGHPVALRLDIPAYEKQGVWVPTIHEGNKTIAHEGAAHISDATFNANENKGIKIATGGQKNPYAVINGKLKKTPTADIHKLAQQYLNHPDWRQVGMDPTRHGYFYDRHTQEPVEHAEEVLQVGPLVLAKNPTYGDKSKYKYASGGEVEASKDINNFPAWTEGTNVISTEKASLHPFKTGEPVTVEAYHGTKRPDRIGSRFLKSRATSGPMAFHTSDPKIASGYAQGKSDTSIDPSQREYKNWFKVNTGGRGKPVDLESAWNYLDPQEKQSIARLAPRVGFDDEASNIVLHPEGHNSGIGNYDYELKQTKSPYSREGNHLKALVESWLNSGSLFGEEEKFKDVLKTAGFPMHKLVYDDPYAEYPFVYKNHIQMKNPLVTGNIPEHVRGALNDAASRDRQKAKQWSADPWDKRSRTLRDWVGYLNDPQTETHAWTSIPDKATEVLKSLGYDGIIDKSGKLGGEKHPVYIPFEENQIKSAIGNRGTYDPQQKDITKAEGGDVEATQQPEDTTPSRQLNDYGLYSHAAEAADALKQDKGSPQQMIASLKGVKPDELYWSGVHNAFRDRKTITKQELADHFRNALPKMSVKTLTPSEGTKNDPNAKYEGWTAERKLRGNKKPYLSSNYREVLQTLPLNDMNPAIGNTDDAEKDFASSHWREPNIVSHVRFSDRETQPPTQKAPKATKSNSTVYLHRGDENSKEQSIAWKTPHKNIFITPSVMKKGKYVVTHGPSGKTISGVPVEFYHAMHKATQLADKYPHVFDLDGKGIVDFIANSENKETVDGIKEIVNSDPPALPVSNKSKSFNKEKILHVDESQSDFGQNFRSHTDALDDLKKRLSEIDPKAKMHWNELVRLSEESPNLLHVDKNSNDPYTSYQMAQYPSDHPEEFEKNYTNISRNVNAIRDLNRNKTSLLNNISDREMLLSKMPKSPYVDNTSKWTDLNVKRVLTEAAKGNYDKVIWTPGSVQSKIYGIGNSYSKILYDPESKRLVATPKGRSKGVTQTVEPQDLPNYIGSELAKKLLESNEYGIHVLRGRNLDVPNPGQEAYYGKIFPRRLLELAREHDPEAALTTHKDNDKLVNGFPAIHITPKMRESILKNGFKAYKTGGYTGDSSILSAAQDPSKAIRKALMVAKKLGKKDD